MKVKIKRIDTSLPLPVYETQGSVGFDLLARETIKIEPGKISLVPGNVIIKVPDGYSLIISLRSSTPRKKGINMPHGIGIIDQDYCGNEDEIKIQVYNFSENISIIEKGEKIAQGLFVKTNIFQFEEVDEITKNSRGGFGSTDKNSLL